MLLKNTSDKPLMGNGVYLAPGAEVDVPSDLAKWALEQWPDSVVKAKGFVSPKDKAQNKAKDK